MEEGEKDFEFEFTGHENLVTSQKLKEGLVCKVIGIGNSMTPILKSRQPVIVEPLKEDTVIEKKDIVFCKVKGHFYLHLVWATRLEKDNKEMYLIGNNHGHANGWIPRSQVFGKVTKIINEY